MSLHRADHLGTAAPGSLRTTPQPTPLPSLPLGDAALPSWVPSSFDLRTAAKRMGNLLANRQVEIRPVHQLVLTDADDTLVASGAATLLRNGRTGALALDPRTEKPLRIGAEVDAERAALEHQFPELPWADLVNDYREFSDAEALSHAPTIDVTARALRAHLPGSDGMRFLITARTAQPVLSALQKLSGEQGLGLSSVLSSGSPAELEALGLSVPLSTPHSKALLIAALVELYRPRRAQLEHVTFYDDSNANLKAAAQLLPKLFPKTRFEFIDVVQDKHGHYRHVPFAAPADG